MSYLHERETIRVVKHSLRPVKETNECCYAVLRRRSSLYIFELHLEGWLEWLASLVDNNFIFLQVGS